jgi:hypothetical protein
MSPIWFNIGALWVVGSALLCALVLAHFYEGDLGPLITLHVMSYVCVLLEFSERLKPRISDAFPLIFLLVPIGAYFTYVKTGLFSLLAYVFTIFLLFKLADLRRR